MYDDLSGGLPLGKRELLEAWKELQMGIEVRDQEGVYNGRQKFFLLLLLAIICLLNLYLLDFQFAIAGVELAMQRGRIIFLDNGYVVDIVFMLNFMIPLLSIFFCRMLSRTSVCKDRLAPVHLKTNAPSVNDSPPER
jgi:hypothetical protein